MGFPAISELSPVIPASGSESQVIFTRDAVPVLLVIPLSTQGTYIEFLDGVDGDPLAGTEPTVWARKRNTDGTPWRISIPGNIASERASVQLTTIELSGSRFMKIATVDGSGAAQTQSASRSFLLRTRDL